MNNRNRVGEETQFKGTEHIFNKIVEENFPNFRKEVSVKVQKSYIRRPNRLYHKKIPYDT